MKNTKFRIIMAVNLIFLVLGTIGNIYGYQLTQDYQFILNTLAVLYSMVYLMFGYKKDAAMYFMWFMLFLAVKELLAIVSMIFEESAPIYAIAIVAIMMICYILLAFTKNLGKKKSYILCGIVIGLSVLTFVSGLLFTPVVISEGTKEGVTLGIFNLTRVLMSIVLTIMVYAKYQDKYSRGSK